ncbi:MAG TPA: thiamine phosphate synthase [Rhodocyclaceae bacterium]|nr:thiamine phosphate synthase [Rhodocyclaceae bacterium]
MAHTWTEPANRRRSAFPCPSRLVRCSRGRSPSGCWFRVIPVVGRRRRGAALVINDDVELAGAVGAAGVHLGQGDGDPAAARERLPAGAIVGVTCHDDFDLARKACAAGADYVAFGAVFPSPTKPKAVVAPLELFARCRRELALPACAIGGVTLANAPLAIAAGADLLAVITDLFSAPDLTVRAFAYQRLFEDSLS